MAEITATELRAWALEREPELRDLGGDAPVYIRIGHPKPKVKSEVRTGADDRDVVLDLDETGRICGIELP